MAKNLLTGVNEVLKRLAIVSEQNLLTTLSNSGKQVFIDLAIQVWNEGVDQLYSKTDSLKAYQAHQDEIILVEGVREYPIPDDLIQMRWPLHDEINGFYINEYKAGYEHLRKVLVQPANRTGIPTFGALSPVEKEIYLDNIPTAGESGYTFTFFYWRDTVLERQSDQFPFDDGVFRAMVPVVVELYKAAKATQSSSSKERAKALINRVNYGRALRMLEQKPADSTYMRRRGSVQSGPLGYDPYN